MLKSLMAGTKDASKKLPVWEKTGEAYFDGFPKFYACLGGYPRTQPGAENFFRLENKDPPPDEVLHGRRHPAFIIDPQLISHTINKTYVSPGWKNGVDSSFLDIIAVVKTYEALYPDLAPAEILHMALGTIISYTDVSGQSNVARVDPRIVLKNISKIVGVGKSKDVEVTAAAVKMAENRDRTLDKKNVMLFSGNSGINYSSIGLTVFPGGLFAFKPGHVLTFLLSAYDTNANVKDESLLRMQQWWYLALNLFSSQIQTHDPTTLKRFPVISPPLAVLAPRFFSEKEFGKHNYENASMSPDQIGSDVFSRAYRTVSNGLIFWLKPGILRDWRDADKATGTSNPSLLRGGRVMKLPLTFLRTFEHAIGAKDEQINKLFSAGGKVDLRGENRLDWERYHEDMSGDMLGLALIDYIKEKGCSGKGPKISEILAGFFDQLLGKYIEGFETYAKKYPAYAGEYKRCIEELRKAKKELSAQGNIADDKLMKKLKIDALVNAALYYYTYNEYAKDFLHTALNTESLLKKFEKTEKNKGETRARIRELIKIILDPNSPPFGFVTARNEFTDILCTLKGDTDLRVKSNVEDKLKITKKIREITDLMGENRPQINFLNDSLSKLSAMIGTPQKDLEKQIKQLADTETVFRKSSQDKLAFVEKLFSVSENKQTLIKERQATMTH
ncbi:Uncharacterised protein [Candidatus Gugararchaeum adminiculabundum]|nr:Uncharacterised protein [Candidatus Gugararchaeum adminiculabundum]